MPSNRNGKRPDVGIKIEPCIYYYPMRDREDKKGKPIGKCYRVMIDRRTSGGRRISIGCYTLAEARDTKAREKIALKDTRKFTPQTELRNLKVGNVLFEYLQYLKRQTGKTTAKLMGMRLGSNQKFLSALDDAQNASLQQSIEWSRGPIKKEIVAQIKNPAARREAKSFDRYEEMELKKAADRYVTDVRYLEYYLENYEKNCAMYMF
jgi:hypothetical protein